MEFGSVEEVLDYAIKQEIEAHDFYKSLAEKENRSGTKQMFEDFAKEEKKHEDLLNKVKAGTLTLQNKGDYKFKWIDDIKRGNFVEEPEYKPGMAYNEVLLIAIKREEKALDLYRELYRQAKTDDERTVFKMLRQEEAKHKLGLEIMYDDYMYEMGD